MGKYGYNMKCKYIPKYMLALYYTGRLAVLVKEKKRISYSVKVNEESDITKREKEGRRKAEGKRGIIMRPVSGVEWALESGLLAGVAVISAVLLAAVGRLCLYPTGVLRL